MESGLPLWQHLTSPQVEELAARDPVAILPLAAIEQHGPHLPLSTDLDIGQGLLRLATAQLPLDCPAVMLPPQLLGASEEHGHFAGTLSLDAATVQDMIVEIGRQLATLGIRRLLLFNSHGGNRQVMDLAGLRLRRRHGMLVVKCSYFRFPLPPALPLGAGELQHGFHGGAVETSLMLHFHPERVRRDCLRSFPSFGLELAQSMARLGPEGQASFAWMAEDLNEAGVVGDTREASEALGRELAAHYAAATAELILETRSFPLARFDQRRD